jgi:hypothetical protein
VSRLLDRFAPPRQEAQPRPLCDAAQLLRDANFVALYADPASPVARRIAELETAIRDVSITELPAIMALKGELKGFLFVRDALARLAEVQAAESSAVVAADPRRGLLPVRPS